MKLTEFQVGARLRVLAYRSQSDYAARLQRLGLVPGTEFELRRFAPLGDPVEIRLRGYSLALRPAEADALTVQPIE